MELIRPVRLQLRRTARFNLQAVSQKINGLPARAVTRPGPCGNPFTVKAALESGCSTRLFAQQFVVDCFRNWIDGSERDWMGTDSERARARLLAALPGLRGHNLGCHCGPDDPCHADILIERANA